MIVFSDGLFSYLSTNAIVTALLGTSRGDGTKGIFPVLAPNNSVLPYITSTQISSQSLYSYDGANRLQWSRWRLTCYGASYLGAKKLANAVKMSLNSYQGTWTNGVQIQDATVELETDDVESAAKGTIYASHIDFRFTWVDPDPSVPFTPTGPASLDIDGGDF